MSGYPLMHHGRRFVGFGFLSGVLFLACTRDLYLDFVPAVLLLFFLLLVSAYDAIYGLIFNRLLLPMGCMALFFAVGKGEAPLAVAASGAVLGFLLLFGLRVLSRGGIGGGDVKLVFVLGFWLGAEGVLLTLFAAFFLGGLAAAFLLAFHQADADAKIAFGPFLSFGAYISLLYGQSLLTLYEEMFS